MYLGEGMVSWGTLIGREGGFGVWEYGPDEGGS